MFGKKIAQAINQNKILSILLACCTVLSILPLVHPGFISTDDGGWMVIRFSAFHQAFIHGQIPTRFLPRLNFEYGFPVTDFLYPGYMYLGEPIHLLKINFVNTIKILFGLSLTSSLFFVYQWLKKLFSPLAALTGGIFYLYSPYHLTDLYVRGSIGEVLALAIIPFILWMIEENKPLSVGLGIGFLILAHNTLAFLFLPLLFIYALLSQVFLPKLIIRQHILKYIILFALGVGLATFFWLPALYDLRYTVFSQTKVSNWQQYFSNIEGIGIINILVFILAAGILLFPKKLQTILNSHNKFQEKQKKIIVFFCLLSGITLFLALPLSGFIWQFLPVAFIQFPFRVLSIEVLGTAFLTAFCIHTIKEKLQKSWSIAIITLLFLLSIPIFIKIRYEDKVQSFYTTNEDTTTVRNEYLPTWVKTLSKHKAEHKIQDAGTIITNIHDDVNRISFTTTLPQSTKVTINTIYFPGWYAKIDGKPIAISYNNPKGLMQLPVPAGTHNAQVYFTETPLRLVSDTISIASLLGLVVYNKIIKPKRIT